MRQTPPLSDRGTHLVDHSPMPEYTSEHSERMETTDLDDPDRYIGLCVSENKLMWDMLEPQLNRNRRVRETSVGYDTMTGSQALRDQLASFGSEHVWGGSVDPDKVVALAGAGSILETLFYVISEPGDGVLVPTPSYAGFWADLETRDELHVVPVHTSSEDGFRLTTGLLEQAYETSTIPISALLLTNPDNPTGRIMAPEELAAVVEWARSHDLHIVMNEIYALSVYGEQPFTPVGSAVDDLRSDVHRVWGFSKDFAMSGVRCGVMTTGNDDVLASVAELAYWAVVSGDTQHLLAEMLGDEEWTDVYLTQLRARLKRSYDATTSALDAAGVPYIDADAGLFVLVDMRAFMEEPTWEAEDDLWRRILDEANVNLTPGSACHIGEPGFMRICFATEQPDVVTRAIERVARVLGPPRTTSDAASERST